MLKLKNKFKVIAFLAIILLTLTLPIVRAENETPASTTTTNETIALNPENNEEASLTSTEDTFKRSDVYLTGNNVNIDYIIDGNLFVIANNVTINSQIGGDAFICANSVTIEEEGYIFSNLFTFAKNTTINGVVYDLYSASESTTVNGYVYRDIHVGSETVNILGTIGRNAFVNCSNLNLATDTNTDDSQATTPTAQASINGNLNYSAKNELSIPEGIVSGQTIFEQKTNFNENTILEQIMSLGTFVITIVAVWLLCLWLAPKFLKNNATLLTTKKVLPVIGFGILTPIVILGLAILFFVLEITSTLGLLLLFILLALIMISNSMFAITLNTIICNQLKIQKTLATFGMLVAISVVLWLIGLIPFIGSILGIIIVILGFGIAVSSLVLKEKEKTETVEAEA